MTPARPIAPAEVAQGMAHVSLFSGVGGFELAMAQAGIPTIAACEIDKAARGVLADHFPDTHIYHDVKGVTGDSLRSLGADPGRTVLTAGWPCFAAGTPILTEDGWIAIEDICVGDRVLTHTGSWRPVVEVMSRLVDEVVEIKAHGTAGVVTTTAEHPFYARRTSREWVGRKAGSWRRNLGTASWVNASDLGEHHVSQVLPEVNENSPGSEDLWWVVGRFLADGWLTTGKRGERTRTVICCGADEADYLAERISRVVHATRADVRTGVKFTITQHWFAELVRPLGRGAHQKTLTRRELELPSRFAAALLDGWMSGDGSRAAGQWKVATTSPSLALSMALIAQRSSSSVATIHGVTPAPKKFIEGRQVNQRPWWQVGIPDSQRSAFVEGKYGWKKVRSVQRVRRSARVYNLGVAGDESYVANGLVVHNCQGNSVAGRRGGMADERSGLWAEVARILAEFRPAWFVGENVPGLLSVAGGWDYATVLGDMARLGYGFAWRVLDARRFGVPQRRRRIVLVGHLGDDGRAPAQVLLEPEGGGRNPAEGITPRPTFARRTGSGAHFRSVSPAVTAKWAKGAGGPAGDEDQNLVLSVTGTTTHALTAEGHDAGEDGTGRGTPIVVAPALAATLTSGQSGEGVGAPGRRQEDDHNLVAYQCHGSNVGPMGTLRAGNGNAAGGVPFIYAAKAASTIQAGGGDRYRVDAESAAGGHLVAYQKVRRSGERGPDGELPPEVWAERDVAATLSPADLTSEHRAVELVAFALRGRDDGALPEVHGDGQTVGSLRAASGGSSRDYIAGTTVRRLTPLEAERLQGYPDGWTLTSNGKPQADGARYKQLGNSIAVPVFVWVAKRLAAVASACHGTGAAA